MGVIDVYVIMETYNVDCLPVEMQLRFFICTGMYILWHLTIFRQLIGPQRIPMKYIHHTVCIVMIVHLADIVMEKGNHNLIAKLANPILWGQE